MESWNSYLCKDDAISKHSRETSLWFYSIMLASGQKNISFCQTTSNVSA